MRQRFISILFVGILFIVSIGNLFVPVKVFSSRENRYLQVLPEISWNKIISGKFSKDFEKYTTDQFIGRNTWISLKTISDLILNKKDNGRIYFGKSGYLFDVDKEIDLEQFKKNVDYINSFLESISKLSKDIDITTLLIPSKSTVLSDKLPAYAPIINERDLVEELLLTLRNVNVLDMSGILRYNSKEYIYYRTDHHWTTLGAYYGYEYYMKSMGLTPKGKGQFERIEVSNDFLGSNYRKSNFYNGEPDIISIFVPNEKIEHKITINDTISVDSIYEDSFLEKNDKYSYFLGGDKPLIEINTSMKNGKTLLVVKDSFGNSFIPFLVNHYANIHIIDPRYFNGSVEKFVEKNKIDEILFLFNIQNFIQEKSLSILVK